MFPQPGRLAAFARTGDALPLPDDVVASVSENWSGDWMSFGNVDGTQFGVPAKSDLKSLVWYIPSAFAEKGYEVPTTLDDFFALTDEMAANGDTPLCVGIESSAATGWPFTDWVEDLVLRKHGVDFYNQWVTHEIPFNSPEIVEIFQQIGDLWNGEGMTYAVRRIDRLDELPGQRRAAGQRRLHDAPSSQLLRRHGRRSTPSSAKKRASTTTSTSRPTKDTPVLTAGLVGSAFRDAPEVWAVMQYLGSPEFANARQTAQAEIAGGLSGYLSANLNADPAVFNEVEQGFIEILQTGSPVAFDASDNMPAEVGSGTFWSEGTSFINGDVDGTGGRRQHRGIVAD